MSTGQIFSVKVRVYLENESLDIIIMIINMLPLTSDSWAYSIQLQNKQNIHWICPSYFWLYFLEKLV
jgi:hypothetical protein